jgi:hypothetical protein
VVGNLAAAAREGAARPRALTARHTCTRAQGTAQHARPRALTQRVPSRQARVSPTSRRKAPCPVDERRSAKLYRLVCILS